MIISYDKDFEERNIRYLSGVLIEH